MPHYGKRAKGESVPRVVVRVEQRHIDESIRCHGQACMLATATEDAYRKVNAKGVLVRAASYSNADLGMLAFTDLNRRRRFKYFVPKVAQLALLAFDQGRPVKPFTMILNQGDVFISGWKGPRSGMASRRGKKYRQTNKPRKSPMPPQTRQFGLCMYEPGVGVAIARKTAAA